MEVYGPEQNFLGIETLKLHDYRNSKVVISCIPYEHTSSYIKGSVQGPEAILNASHYVEYYDEELDTESYKKIGIATLKPLEFNGKVDKDAMNLIENHTDILLNDGKFPVSLAGEHTATYGLVKAFSRHFDNLTVLQIDAHSDLRQDYHNNIWSHASVMRRIHEIGNISISQAGIRAQCAEEAEFIKKSSDINTFYAHGIYADPNWINNVLKTISDKVYITIDADGFDPSVIPAVGTPEPGGFLWGQVLDLLKAVCKQKQVLGFDVVECAPIEGSIISQYTLARLVYRLLGYMVSFKKIK